MTLHDLAAALVGAAALAVTVRAAAMCAHRGWL